ncbi:MAG: VCBS repeat-containing protein [Verrucomicrobia bacterium]|nr:VCBS repeat-containing protein [Verrucomicrobiota bacterium]
MLGPVASTGPLAFGDVDGDGTLELFIGGRLVAGRYPEPATSLLLRNEGGRFVVAQRLEELGLVSGAVFSDLDQDGLPELVLACEWGPLRLFKFADGRLVAWPVNVTGLAPNPAARVGLEHLRGWWNGVTTGDFDGDGRLDLWRRTGA